MQPAYISLDALCRDWAAQADKSEKDVASALCTQIRARSFNLTAFTHTPTGNYLGSRAFDNIASKIRSANAFEQQDAWMALSEIRIKTSDLLEFCHLTSTRPPLSVTGAKGRLQWQAAKHLAPPSRARHTGASAGQRQTMVSDETNCRNWLIELMEAGPPTKPKPAYRSEAGTRFGVGTKGFNRAWDAALDRTGNTDWSKPGRKS